MKCPVQRCIRRYVSVRRGLCALFSPVAWQGSASGRWRALGHFATVLLLAGLMPLWVSGQTTTGSITGTVTDASGAVVPGASVTVTSESTKVANATRSDPSGRYEFLSLPAGRYSIAAVHEGFVTTQLTGILLDVAQSIITNVVLKVGGTEQTVRVEAAPTLVDTTSASLGTVVEQQAIENMPLNLREVGSLALLVPGTVNTTGRSLATGAANGSGFNDFGYAGAGGGSGGNLLLIDGMISRALNNSSFALDPPPEMVKEFKIQTNVYDASFGLAAGSVMNMITNSGADQVHGSAWEYVRNSAMDASGYFALSRPDLSRHQFGGAIGGPIKKGKIFYFGSYEGLRLTEAVVSSSVVPTVAEKTGDFSSFLTGTTTNLCAASGSAAPGNLNFDSGQLFDPRTESVYACPQDPSNPSAQPATVLLGTPIAGNQIANLDPVAQKVLALFPDPNTSGVVNYTNQTPQQQQNEQYDARVDANLTKADRLFVRYLIGNSNILFPGALPTFNGYQHFRGQNLVGGWTRVLGPSAINDVRIGYQRDYLTYTCQTCPRAAGTLASFGIAGLTNPLPQFNMYPNIVMSNFPLWGDGFPGYFPVTAPDSVEQYEDTFTKVAGRHTLSLGADLDFWQTKGVTDPVQANGQFGFDGQFSSLAGEIPGVSSVSDLADLELGFPSTGEFTKNAIITNLVGGRWISAFAQDSFRAASHFTVQYGLRWEYRRQPMDAHNQIATFFPLSKAYTPGDGLLLTALPDAQNDALCSNAYFLSASGECLVMTSAQRRAHGLTGNKVRQVSYGPGAGYFAPRLGLSWQPTGSDRLVVHTGAGIFMDLPDTNRMGSFANNNPIFTETPNYAAPFGAPPPVTNGTPTTTQNVFQNAPLVSLSGITSQLMPSPFYKTPQTYEWSLNVQYQVARQWGTEVAYIGNRGLHLDYMFNTGNQPKPGVGDLQPRRPWPDFGPMLYDDYEGASKYQAGYVKLEKRASHGLAAMISYTLAKSTDNEGGNIDNQSTIQNYNDPNADYGPSDFDVRHTFIASPVYELPFGTGEKLGGGRAINAFAGGWQVSAIVSASSGLPFTVRSNQDYSNTGSPSPRPDRTCNGSGPKKLDEWFNPGCFTTAALAQDFANGNPRFGNSGRNILRQPGMQNWDIGFTKRTNLPKGLIAEIKGEFFNAFNHTNWGPPGATIGSSTVGVISSQAGSPRNVQLAVKIDF